LPATGMRDRMGFTQDQAFLRSIRRHFVALFGTCVDLNNPLPRAERTFCCSGFVIETLGNSAWEGGPCSGALPPPQGRNRRGFVGSTGDPKKSWGYIRCGGARAYLPSPGTDERRGGDHTHLAGKASTAGLTGGGADC